MRDIRLLPILMVACTAMLSLKLLGFLSVPGDVWREFAGISNVYAQQEPTLAPLDGAQPATADGRTPNSELSILESLRSRRTQLTDREKELQLRENLIEAAEDRLEGKISELEALEQRLKAATEAELGARNEELRGLVTMYETMKPKDAARIFDRLQMDVLLDVVNAMNPRKMAAVMASMNPEAAQKLTSSMAQNGRRDEARSIDQLPKIGG